MKGLFVRNAGRGAGPAASKERSSGLGSIELLAALGLIAILFGLAAPSYHDAIDKRRLTHGAELIVAFVAAVQSESVKRNRAVTVAYATGDDGRWCVGARLGQTACDCMETNPAEPSWCGREGVPWVMRDSDVDASNLVQSMAGDGYYVFDPVRGLFTDPDDTLTLNLSVGEGRYQARVSVVSTGKVSVCLPEASLGIHGFQSCPQGQ